MNFIESSKTYIVLFILLFLTYQQGNTQVNQNCLPGEPAIELVLPDEISGEPGDIVCVDLVINGFQDITLFFFVVNFSSTSLIFDSANPLVSGLPSFSASDIIPPFGPDNLDRIRVFWSQPNLFGESLPDGSTLVELCFEIIGTPGNDGIVHINSSGLNGILEFLTPAGENIPVCIPGDGTQVRIVPPFSPEPQGFVTSNCGTPLGLAEGVVEITIFNGTGPYTIIDDLGSQFMLNPGENSFVVSGLDLGSREYSIRDAMGTLSNPITLNTDNAPPFDVTIITKQPDCPLDINGRITLEVSGGTPFEGNEYFFDWGSEQVGFGTNELRNLINGVYPVSIVDSLGCIQREVIELNRSDIEIVPIDISDALCAGRNNGIIRVGATGGGPYSGGRYTFTLEGVTDDGQLFIDSRQEVTEAQFSLLPPGEYTITAQDSVDRRMNCAPQNPFIIGTQRNLSVIDLPGNNGGCIGATESIQLVISSNEMLEFPLNIEIRDSTGFVQFAGAINSDTYNTECLPQGTYDIAVNDGIGCELNASFSILGCTLTLTDSLITQPACSGESSGSISLTAESENLPIRFFWNTGDTTSTISMLDPGTYQVTISDDSGCEILESYDIVAPASISVTMSADSILCRGLTGNVIATPNGGNEPYQYQWFPNPQGTTGSLLSDVTTGTYTVIVSDVNGCAVTDSFLLSEPGLFDIEVSNISAPVCAGQATGTAVINANNTPDYTGPFSYLSSTGLNGIGANFSVDNFPSGRNWVLASDGTCVSDTIYIDIPERLPISLDLDISIFPDISCFGGSGDDGSIVNLSAIGGNGTPVSFEWPDIGPGVTGNVQIGLGAGTYTIVMTNSSGCTSTDSITLAQPDSLEVVIDSLNSIFALCGGDNSTELTIGHFGGIENGTFVYAWEDEAGMIISNTTTATSLNPGLYSISVTDENNCTTSISTTVTEAEPVEAILGDVLDPLCVEDLGLITIDTAFGGVPGYRYQVNTSNTMDITQPFSVIPGSYTVRVFDQNGCEWSDMVTINNAEELSVNAGPDLVLPLGRTGQIRAEINNIIPIDTILWTPNSYDCLLSNCQEISVSPVTNQIYEVTVTDDNGCVVTDEVMVSLQSTRNVFIPTAFNPDSQISGNAFFRVYPGSGVQIVDYIRIFDRWGNLVYEDTNLLPSLSGSGSWDGRYNGSEMEPGVYVYVVKVTYIDSDNEIRKGDVTLIR